MSYAEPKPTLDSDIAAFKHKHAYDHHEERVVAAHDDGNIIEIFGSFEVFTFSAPELGDVTFDVRGIKDALVAGMLLFGMLEAELTKEWVDYIRINNGVEAERMASLTAADLERPGICVLWPNGYTTVIDGNNRLVRRWDDGLRTFRFANIAASRELVPYLCRPGQEDKFMRRNDAERGLTPISIKKIAIV